MSATYRSSIIAALIFLLPVSPPLSAENDGIKLDLKYQVEAARKLMAKERRVVIAGEMNLSDSERRPFWDLYNEYAEEMRKIDMEQARQITLYAESYQNLSDETATELLNGYFAVQRDTLKIREKYRKRFSRVIPIIKVARFYQTENKLDAIYEFQLASQIPMIEEPAGN